MEVGVACPALFGSAAAGPRGPVEAPSLKIDLTTSRVIVNKCKHLIVRWFFNEAKNCSLMNANRKSNL